MVIKLSRDIPMMLAELGLSLENAFECCGMVLFSCVRGNDGNKTLTRYHFGRRGAGSRKCISVPWNGSGFFMLEVTMVIKLRTYISFGQKWGLH